MDELQFLKKFGLNFKIARIKNEFSQDDIVDKTGLSKAYISNIENAKHNLSLINAYKLATSVNATIDELINNN